MDSAADCDMFANERNAVAFLGDDERQRAAIALAHGDDHLALAGSFFGDAAVNALLNLVLWLDVTGKIRAVNFDCT